jgi:hypothetical protein
MTVTQAAEDQAIRAEEQPQGPGENGAAFDCAVSEFLSYLQGYRQPALSASNGYSPWTVGAYGIDLREFREFLVEQAGPDESGFGNRVPAPSEITRPQVVAWGLRLKDLKPLTIATLRSSEPALPLRYEARAAASTRASRRSSDSSRTWAGVRATRLAICRCRKCPRTCLSCSRPSRSSDCSLQYGPRLQTVSVLNPSSASAMPRIAGRPPALGRAERQPAARPWER